MTGIPGPAGVAAQPRPLPAGAAPRERVRAWMSWSTGKDSAYALRLAHGNPWVDVAGLFTTVDADACRVAYNGVPVCLAHAQAQALGLPLHTLPIPAGCSAHAREALRRDVLSREAVPAGISMLIFGDAAGRDIRASRAARLAGLGIRAVFPLWGMDTRLLAHRILAAGIGAVITRADLLTAGAGWAGRPFDEEFIAALGEGADPCGENGEFHTFTSVSPDFRHPVPVAVDRVSGRDGVAYAEVIPAGDGRRGP